MKKTMADCTCDACMRLKTLADYLVKKSIWIIGGDGWAYDIGFGGLDHVIASGANVNLLVLDTEVYSNTGGQASKSTPMGAVARFAEGGKTLGKKDLGLIAMTYGNVYVGQVAWGADDAQTVKTFIEAESYNGPSIILAYSHCINHGLPDIADGKGGGIEAQRRVVQSGHWPLYRFDPRLLAEGKNPLQVDSKAPVISLEDWAKTETRFSSLMKSNPEVAKKLLDISTRRSKLRLGIMEQLSKLSVE